jgi:acetoacetyl-CoA synthetase
MTTQDRIPTRTSDTPIWRPSEARKAGSQLSRFLAWLTAHQGVRLEDFDALYRWSVERPEGFWSAVREYGQVIASGDWERVIERPWAMPGARWFPGARLNFAENLLRRNDQETALVFRGESGERSTLSFRELRAQVAAMASWMQSAGVGPGDRVAGLMPNRPETVVAMLAAASLGAVWASASPDFGADGVVERFGQIAPKVLVAVDGYHYNGKVIDIRAKLADVVQRIPSLQRVVLAPWVSDGLPDDALPCPLGVFPALLAEHMGSALPAAQLPFDHPLFILFSSGTTGRPKCIVHGAGGTLLQHIKELMLHTDLRPGDRFFYYTTCGWMMWNWLVSGLAVGATLVLFDGSPFYPDPGVLWDLAEEERITVFGTSAKYLTAIEKTGLKPREGRDLSRLRTLLSTGSPLAPDSFDYVYRDIASDILLASISGGTDIVSCFALGNPLLPVYRGELQCRGLGLAVEVFDAGGRSVVGHRGELVCTRPFPSMPVGFWNDPDGSRYRAAYFQRFPGVWTHGDFAELTPRGGLIIYGRSDAVLNPGGVRIGTAEIYRVVEGMEAVLESAAVAQDWEGDQRILLLVVLRPGLELDDGLRDDIRRRIRSRLSPRHVPARILQIDEIPRTRSGKIVELAIRDVIHGREVKHREALANPQALDVIAALPGLWV